MRLPKEEVRHHRICLQSLDFSSVSLRFHGGPARNELGAGINQALTRPGIDEGRTRIVRAATGAEGRRPDDERDSFHGLLALFPVMAISIQPPAMIR